MARMMQKKRKEKRIGDVCGDHIGGAGPEGINGKYKGVEAQI